MPNPKSGKTEISIETVNIIETFCQDDKNSRLMPGRKDYVEEEGKNKKDYFYATCMCYVKIDIEM